MLLAIGMSLSFGAVNVFAQEEVTFTIRQFKLSGNTLFPGAVLRTVIGRYRGKERTADDVEKARSALERYHHQKGYPTVLVNIPEQSVEDGTVRLEVIESRIRDVFVVNNRYFSKGYVLKDMPSLQPGKMIYLPALQEQLARVNRSADLRVTPVVVPTQVPGLLDIELDVKDSLPFHGSIGFNNKATDGTKPLRFNLSLAYDNLWQLGHSISFQYQTSPQNFDEVQVFAGSYVMPSPFAKDHILAVYGVKSDTDRAIGDGFATIGTGIIIGARYIIPLPDYGNFSHNVTLGLDYKDFEETVGTEGGELQTPISYMPLSASYGTFLNNRKSTTALNGTVNLLLRGLLSNMDEFDDKRFKTRGNHMYFLGSIEHNRELPWGLRVREKLDGQVSDQPLISNEQYSAGGMDTVRGYKESTAVGDNAFRSTTELWSDSTDFGAKVGKSESKLIFNPFIFYDVALLWTRQPLDGQDDNVALHGTGLGVRGSYDKFNFEVDYGTALSETADVNRYDGEIHFTAEYRF